MIAIKQGLDLPITGEPTQTVDVGPSVTTVALVGDDYIGMKPAMAVAEGDAVKLGQLLYTDRKTSGVRYTSPGCGKVLAVNRGAKRAFQSIVIELDGDDEKTFRNYADVDLTTLTRDQVCENLVESGLWTALRTRPYAKVPAPKSVPDALFVTVMDTNPHAVDPPGVIAESAADFVFGLQCLRHLTDGAIFLCKAAGAEIPGDDLDFVSLAEFAGPHPAGLPGTHIHFLFPVCEKKTVWHVNYQDVIAVGRLFTTGRLSVERIISLAGPAVKNPRLLRTRIGASTQELTSGELKQGESRVVSGSVLSGRRAVAQYAYLGRYHLQVSALFEGREREFLGWHRPGLNKFSMKRVFASAFFGNGGRGNRGRFPLSTSTEGSRRAMVPIGMYEQVMPLDIIPTFLLRALIVGDSEQAQALGCLELDEEDLALCTFVCPGKYEYGPLLREILTRIEKEG